MEADCKSAGSAYGGSNPSLPTLEDWLSGLKQQFAKLSKGLTLPLVQIQHPPPGSVTQWQSNGLLTWKLWVQVPLDPCGRLAQRQSNVLITQRSLVQIQHFPLDNLIYHWYDNRVEKSTAVLPFSRFRSGGDRNLLYVSVTQWTRVSAF